MNGNTTYQIVDGKSIQVASTSMENAEILAEGGARKGEAYAAGR
jgi:hypothetical protein